MRQESPGAIATDRPSRLETQCSVDDPLGVNGAGEIRHFSPAERRSDHAAKNGRQRAVFGIPVADGFQIGSATLPPSLATPGPSSESSTAPSSAQRLNRSWLVPQSPATNARADINAIPARHSNRWRRPGSRGRNRDRPAARGRRTACNSRAYIWVRRRERSRPASRVAISSCETSRFKRACRPIEQDLVAAAHDGQAGRPLRLRARHAGRRCR